MFYPEIPFLHLRCVGVGLNSDKVFLRGHIQIRHMSSIFHDD